MLATRLVSTPAAPDAAATLSCTIWIYMGIKDKDTPRALMETMYLLLALRAIYNWLT